MKQDERARASAFKIGDRLIIHSDLRTVKGFWVCSEPFIVLPTGATLHEIGEAVQTALAESRMGVPVPPDLKAVTKPLLRAAGVSSYRLTAVCYALFNCQDPKGHSDRPVAQRRYKGR